MNNTIFVAVTAVLLCVLVAEVAFWLIMIARDGGL